MKKGFLRLLRSTSATLVGLILTSYLQTPKGQAITPILMAVGAYARSNWPTKTKWIPF